MIMKKNSPRRQSKKDPFFTRSPTSGSVSYALQHHRQIEEIKAKDKLDTLILEAKEEEEKWKLTYEKNLDKAKKLQYEISQIKPEIKINRSAQMEYYLYLLEGGKDTRNLGLGWILKTIWYLGGKTPNYEKFPKFLDSEGIENIINVFIG